MYNKYLAELSKEQLLELIELYAKNWLAHDGVWFQSIERKFGMAEAMYHDEEAWKRFTVIEAKRIKEFCSCWRILDLRAWSRRCTIAFTAI